MKIGELKHAARHDVRIACPKAWWMTLVYLLVTSGLSFAVGLFAADPILQLTQLYQGGVPLDRAILLAIGAVGGTGMFLNLVILLTGIVFDFGYAQWCLGTARGGIGELSDLLGGFAMVGRVLLLRVTTLLYCFMWYVVIFMPALIVVLLAAALPVIGPLLVVAAFLGALVLFVWRVLGYSMATFCLMDEPDMGVTHALRTSRLLMYRHAGQYILLLLSFIGWELLAAGIALAAELLVGLAGAVLIPALGLNPEWLALVGKGAATVGALASWPLYLWLTPYITMSQCRFYDELKHPKDSIPF